MGRFDPGDVEDMTRAVEAAGVTPLVRVPTNNPRIILRYMDGGPQGVMIPWCQSAAEAEAAVRATKYYPEGNRGLAGVRAARFGVGLALTEHVKTSNEETLVIAQIETVATIEALPEMLRVPGVDVFFIGPNDLAQSLGYPARQDEPVVQEMIESTLTTIIGAGKTAGIMVRDGAAARRYRERGVQFISIGASSVIAPATRAFLKAATA